MITRAVAAATHGRVLIEPASDAAGLLVGFHGYGQNAGIFMDELRRIPRAAPWTLVSVQGLHRFYDRANHVVASWMTREDRELAIADNIAYVDAAIDGALADAPRPQRIVVVGFSQGVAMAYRAAARGRHRADGLVALAGDVPPDVAASGAALPRVLLGRGTADTWYTTDKMDADLGALGRLGVRVQPIVFDGGHEWSRAFLEAAGRFLAEIAAEAA